MVQYLLEASQVTDFVSHLCERKTVYAPHRKGRRSFAFDEVTDPDAVVLDYDRSLHSVKKYFLPPQERLLSFNIIENDFESSETLPLEAVFLGVHSYDMQAVLKLDHNFSLGHPEKHYLVRREGAVFIGVSFEPDPWHFSGSVGIGSREMRGFDMFLDKVEAGYVVTAMTEAGIDLLVGFEITEWTDHLATEPGFQQHIYVPQDKLGKVFDDSWNNAVWQEVAEQCTGCGTCNLVCPTCYCFDVEDTVDITVTRGTRDRSWDGCMLRPFTEVAGGEIFREELSARQRHRIYRKFKYISDETSEPWCVGCGRCTQSCTARISIVSIVNRLVNDHNRDAEPPRGAGGQA